MDEVMSVFPLIYQKEISPYLTKYHQLEEIRIRAHQPLQLLFSNQSIWLTQIVGDEDCHTILTNITNYSMYRYDEQIKQGYLTMKGGHRVGLAGEVVLKNNNISYMTNITYMNIRIAKQLIYDLTQVIQKLVKRQGLYNCCIIGPPQVGKTTFIRSLSYELSKQYKTFLIDERSELSETMPRTAFRMIDILKNCPKHIAVTMAIRSMSPELIVVDEIGSNQDVIAIHDAMNAGVNVMCTIHGYHKEDIDNKTIFNEKQNLFLFDRYIILERKKDEMLAQFLNAEGKKLQSIEIRPYESII